MIGAVQAGGGIRTAAGGFRRRVEAIASAAPGGEERLLPPPDDGHRCADEEALQGRRAEAERSFCGVVSSTFVTQLIVSHIGTAEGGDRRQRRDPSLVRVRANGAYRQTGGLVSSIEAGFLKAVSY